MDPYHPGFSRLSSIRRQLDLDNSEDFFLPGNSLDTQDEFLFGELDAKENLGPNGHGHMAVEKPNDADSKGSPALAVNNHFQQVSNNNFRLRLTSKKSERAQNLAIPPQESANFKTQFHIRLGERKFTDQLKRINSTINAVPSEVNIKSEITKA